MSAKISELPAAGPLAGTESIPAVQGGANVKTRPLDLANFMAGVPNGLNSFRVLKFGNCLFDPNNDETIVLATNSGNAGAISFVIPDGHGGFTGVGYVGGRADSGGFLGCGASSHPFTIENCAGLNLNWRPLFDANGALLCADGTTPLLQGANGPIQPIADSTGTEDLVDKFNALLAGLRMLGLLAT
jgi:hypothetical protein